MKKLQRKFWKAGRMRFADVELICELVKGRSLQRLEVTRKVKKLEKTLS
jgi:hypothetical protein